MADVPPHTDSNGDTGGDTGAGPGREPTPSTPRWVYIFGIVAFVLVLAFAILHLTGRGLGGHAQPSNDSEHARQLP